MSHPTIQQTQPPPRDSPHTEVAPHRTAEWPHIIFRRAPTTRWRARALFRCFTPTENPHRGGDAPVPRHQKTRRTVEWSHIKFGEDPTTRSRARALFRCFTPTPPGGSPPTEVVTPLARNTTRRATL